jgi:hypothetical protein
MITAILISIKLHVVKFYLYNKFTNMFVLSCGTATDETLRVSLSDMNYAKFRGRHQRQ